MVVVSDPKSAITMTVAASNSAIFSGGGAQKPPPIPGKFIAMNERKLLKDLEINGGGGRLSSWVESMRASSPTHIHSTPSVSDDLALVTLPFSFCLLCCSILWLRIQD